MNFKGVETTNQVTYGGVLCNSGLIVVNNSFFFHSGSYRSIWRFLDSLIVVLIVAYEGFVDMGDPKVTMVVSILSRGHP